MPFERSTDALRRLVDEATRLDEVRGQLNRVSRNDRSKLEARLLEDPNALWNTAASEIQSADALEAKLADDLNQIQRLLPVQGRGIAFLHWVYDYLLPFSVAILVVAYFFGGFIIGFETPFNWLAGTGAWMALLLLVVVLVLAYFAIDRPQRARYRELTDRLTKKGEADLRIDDTRQRLSAARAAVAVAVRDNGIVRLLRLWVAEKLTPVYDTTLAFTSAPGLHGAYSNTLEIMTPAHARLNSMLVRWGGGSIGIAGPRGAGKSTLIQSVCQDGVSEIPTKNTLGIVVSAPVEYQPRDFLLHLFATVCHRVLERADKKYTRFDWKDELTRTLPTVPREWMRLLLRSAAWACLTGLALLFTGWLLAAMNLEAKAPPRLLAASAPAAPAAPSGASAAGLASTPTSASSAALVASPSFAGKAASAAPSSAASAPQSAASAVASLMGELDIRPGALWSWGWWMLVFSILSFMFAEWTASRLPAFVSGTGLSGSPPLPRGANTVPTDQAPPDMIMFPFNALARVRCVYAVFADPPAPVPEARALHEARRWLTEIKFQQSFTSSWSGAVKLAFGAESSTSRGRSLAQQQLTLPEIVDGFTRFLGQVILDFEYVLIIGIDELDKLADDSKAQRFLNEIKAIFGIDGVYYLISVSEDAMSNFERRGLPFRDAFDSAFDEVIAVDYLSFENTRRLLNERVIGLPVQFQALCHCLSGGLARELIRSCRDLVEQAGAAKTPSDLETLARVLMQLDLRAKLRAIGFAIQRVDAEPERSEVLHLLHTLAAGDIAAGSLHDAHRALARVAESAAAGEPLPGSELVKLHNLALEAGSYLYYLATLLELFTNRLDQAAMQALGNDRIDMLARALQALSVSPHVTRGLLDLWRMHRPKHA